MHNNYKEPVLDPFLCHLLPIAESSRFSPRLFDTEFVHARAKRAGIEAEPDGCAALSLDPPAGLFQHLEDMMALDVLQGA